MQLHRNVGWFRSRPSQRGGWFLLIGKKCFNLLSVVNTWAESKDSELVVNKQNLRIEEEMFCTEKKSGSTV